MAGSELSFVGKGCFQELPKKDLHGGTAGLEEGDKTRAVAETWPRGIEALCTMGLKGDFLRRTGSGAREHTKSYERRRRRLGAVQLSL